MSDEIGECKLVECCMCYHRYPAFNMTVDEDGLRYCEDCSKERERAKKEMDVEMMKRIDREMEKWELDIADSAKYNDPYEFPPED